MVDTTNGASIKNKNNGGCSLNICGPSFGFSVDLVSINPQHSLLIEDQGGTELEENSAAEEMSSEW